MNRSQAILKARTLWGKRGHAESTEKKRRDPVTRKWVPTGETDYQVGDIEDMAGLGLFFVRGSGASYEEAFEKALVEKKKA